MNTATTILASILLVAGPPVQQERPVDPRGIFLANCDVALIKDVRVPARQPGILKELKVDRGDIVSKDDVLGRLDDQEAQIRLLIATKELEAATATAESQADVLAAEATIDVAKAEFEKSKDIQRRARDAVSEFEMDRLDLTHKRSKFQAESARVEHSVNQITRKMREDQLLAVEHEISQKMITAPIGGMVEERFHNEGEWVQAGEPIFRVVLMDRLRVEGMLRVRDVMPAEVLGSDVEIKVKTSGGTFVRLDAKIDFASQVVDPSGEFLIHAEITNQKDSQGQWIVLPGLDAEMDIKVRPSSSARQN